MVACLREAKKTTRIRRCTPASYVLRSPNLLIIRQFAQQAVKHYELFGSDGVGRSLCQLFFYELELSWDRLSFVCHFSCSSAFACVVVAKHIWCSIRVVGAVGHWWHISISPPPPEFYHDIILDIFLNPTRPPKETQHGPTLAPLLAPWINERSSEGCFVRVFAYPSPCIFLLRRQLTSDALMVWLWPLKLDQHFISSGSFRQRQRSIRAESAIDSFGTVAGKRVRIEV